MDGETRTDRGRVFAFEPQPTLAKRLDAQVKSHKLDQVSAEQMGISGTTAKMKLRMPLRVNSPGGTQYVNNFLSTQKRVS